MFIKIIKEYRDTTRDYKIIPTNGIYEVSETRGNELIKAGVGEEYNFPISAPKSKTTKKAEKDKTIEEPDENKVIEEKNEETIDNKTDEEVEIKTDKNE